MKTKRFFLRAGAVLLAIFMGAALSFPQAFAGGIGEIVGVVTQLLGAPLSGTAPTTNQVLKYNGTQWAPATDGGGGETLAQTLALGNSADRQINWSTGAGAITHVLGPTDQTFKISSGAGRQLEINAASTGLTFSVASSNVLSFSTSTGAAALSNYKFKITPNAGVDTDGVVNITGGTITQSEPVFRATQTWDNVATTFNGILTNTTVTAAAAASRILNLQVASSSVFSVATTGALYNNGQWIADANMASVFTDHASGFVVQNMAGSALVKAQVGSLIVSSTSGGTAPTNGIGSLGLIGFLASAGGAVDTCLSRASANVAVLGNAAGDFTGTLKLTNLQLGASYTTGDLLYASSSTVLSKLAASTSGFVLTANGAGVAPSWQAAAGGLSGITNSTPGQLAWSAGSGAITHLLGPTDQNLKIAATTAGATSAGRALTLNSGPGGATSGNSGSITISPGTVTSGNGGSISIAGATAVGGNNTGSTISIQAGDSVGSGTGPTLAITAGGSNGGSGAGGQLQLFAGGGNSAAGGLATLSGGSSLTGAGGATLVKGGSPINTLATDQNAGGLTLTSGTPTGTGNGQVKTQTGYLGASSSDAQTLYDREVVTSKSFACSTTTGTANTICLLSNAVTTSGGGAELFYTIEVKDASNVSTITGSAWIAAENRAGTVLASCTAAGATNQIIQNSATFTSLACTTTATVSGTNVQIKVTPSWSGGTPTVVRCTYQVRANGQCSITPQ